MIRDISEIKLGDKVSVSTWGEGIRDGIVDEVSADIKNGCPGISYTDAKGDGWWCYLDQIISVEAASLAA